MDVKRLDIPDVLLITPVRHGDSRGWFSETYMERRFAEAGIAIRFVQDNQAFSSEMGTVRGLHFQTAPFAQTKLVRALRGSILDVAVDIRRGSPTYGKWVSAVLTAAEGNQLLVPVGFAHGYCTLEPDTEIFYKVDNFYSAAHDFGVSWDDPALGIPWPVSGDAAQLSAKDRKQPSLAELPPYFA